MSVRILYPALALVAAAGLAACSSSDYGRHGYGYSRVAVGVGYSAPYYGWYDGFYYPGTGYYVYDRHGARHRWRDRDRRHWEGRRHDQRRDNWSGYHYRRDDRRWDRDDRRGWRDNDRRGRHGRRH
jgi:hypothetical protein